MKQGRVAFGLGLISLGRTWGFKPRSIPGREEASVFLQEAVRLGVTVFDTAPSYGSSEEKTGAFFRSLPAVARGRLMLATKFGETWDEESQQGIPGHSYDVLCRSLDRSLALLGRIDLLQIHKTTVEVLRSPDLGRALAYARGCGIPLLGASVKDIPAGRLACQMEELRQIQMPYHLRNRELEPLFAMADRAGKQVWTNRPFGMGALLHDGAVPAQDAYAFVLRQPFHGAVLTGTADADHLRLDLAAFRAASEA